jgi:hypothetical protein
MMEDVERILSLLGRRDLVVAGRATENYQLEMAVQLLGLIGHTSLRIKLLSVARRICELCPGISDEGRCLLCQFDWFNKLTP